MPAVTPSMVKELREKTGAGMLDCKKALEASNCDIEEAVNADTSLNYLGVKALEMAGIKKFAYQNFLTELEKDYPVISAMQVQKADGSVTNQKEDDDRLRLYQSIQYYYLFDQ